MFGGFRFVIWSSGVWVGWGNGHKVGVGAWLSKSCTHVSELDCLFSSSKIS